MNEKLNDIKRYDYSDILGWSVSRYDKFKLCQRQYYFDYYGKYDTEYPRSKISALKSMTSTALETGNIIHDTIKALLERLLKSEKPVNSEKFLDYARQKTVEYCDAKTFAEVYYQQLEKIDTDRIYESVKSGLNNFIGSDRCRWIMEKAITNKTGWIIEPPGYGETRIDGMKAYCKVDFLFPVDSDIFILDWKTGKPDEKKHAKQLIGYSTWAANNFGREPSRIFPVTAYLLPQYAEISIKVSVPDIAAFTDTVKTETSEMYAALKSIEQNIPKEKKEFAMTGNLKICGFCNYRELCFPK
ncbi:MAG: PD-(D/E)XK nuclease family protein [Elusimicrobia bacterium]|nr:PD-(D/E)XK nuclease family protein [Elusimicrobiota bacterium]